MEVLKGKKILIISQQPWSDMRISKHHYAIELANLNNEVFFLNPNSKEVKRGSCRISLTTKEGVKVLDYRPIFPMRLKFSLNTVFNFFMKREVRNIIEVIAGAPDVVWDFEPTRQFKDLNWFQAKIKIYHPVDSPPRFNEDIKNADVIFSVSDHILDHFERKAVVKKFINHGLSDAFKRAATNRLYGLEIKKDRKEINAGYIGNLLMKHIDHETFKEIIKTNPHVKFHIWGPYDFSMLNAKDPFYSQIEEFILYLKKQTNVVLYGLKSQELILPDLNNIDLFFWCYDNSKDPNKGSNSHKILEYLSTGKVVVSTPISTYKNIEEDGMIVMANRGREFVNIFKLAIENIDRINSYELKTKRIKFALDNSYDLQIQRIDDILAQIKSNQW